MGCKSPVRKRHSIGSQYPKYSLPSEVQGEGHELRAPPNHPGDQGFSASVEAPPKWPSKDLNKDCRDLLKTEHGWQQLRSGHSFRVPEPMPCSSARRALIAAIALRSTTIAAPRVRKHSRSQTLKLARSAEPMPRSNLSAQCKQVAAAVQYEWHENSFALQV